MTHADHAMQRLRDQVRTLLDDADRAAREGKPLELRPDTQPYRDLWRAWELALLHQDNAMPVGWLEEQVASMIDLAAIQEHAR